jgi:hypothetical protein
VDWFEGARPRAFDEKRYYSLGLDAVAERPAAPGREARAAPVA